MNFSALIDRVLVVFKCFSFAILGFLAYTLLGLIFALIIKEPILSSIAFDVVIILSVFLIAPKMFKLDISCFKRFGGFMWIKLISIFFLIWLGVQFISTGYYNIMGDDVFDVYAARFDNANPLYVTLLVLLIAPISEELFFRGLVFDNIKHLARKFPGMDKFLSYFISSLVFAAVHGTALHMIVGFFIGLYLGFIYDMTKSVFACIAFHALYNALGFTQSDVSDSFMMMMASTPSGWLLCDGLTCLVFASFACLYVYRSRLKNQ